MKKYLLCLGLIGTLITISPGATAVNFVCAGKTLTSKNQKEICNKICAGQWKEPNMASLIRCKTPANPRGYACDCQ